MDLRNLLCIDIGASNIKIVYGRKLFGKIHINCSEIISTPAGAFANGYINDMPLISEKITEFKKNNKLVNPSGAFVINSSDIVIRNITLPIMSKKNIASSIEWDLGQFIKGTKEDYYIEYSITAKENKQYKLFCIIVPKLLIDQYETLAKNTGIKIKSIEAASVCSVRLLNDTVNNHIIMDFGYESVRISYCSGKVVIAERVLVFKPAMDKNLSCNPIEEKKDESFRNEKCTMDGNTCVYLDHFPERNLESIFRNLTQFIDYFHASNSRISGICAIGGMAQDFRICESLGDCHIEGSRITINQMKINADNGFKLKLELYANVLGLLCRK